MMTSKPEFSHQAGPFYYLGNRCLTLPDYSGRMKNNSDWFTSIFSIITASRTTRYKKCYEPFAGSLAFSLAAMAYGLADEYIVNDSNEVMINAHHLIQVEPALIKDNYSALVEEYEQSDCKKSCYISIIDRYNKAPCKEKALLLPFIINHCWGGMIYHNADREIIYQEPIIKGNTLSGYLTHGNLPLTSFFDEVDRASYLLNKNKVTFKSGDFLSAIVEAGCDDFILLDPPYPENQKLLDDTAHLYTELYSAEKLHQHIIETIKYFESQHITYFMTYGCYNRALSQFVLSDTLKTNRYFHLLGFDDCAFGMALDQVYFSSHLRLSKCIRQTFIPTKAILNGRLLPESDALHEYNAMKVTTDSFFSEAHSL